MVPVSPAAAIMAELKFGGLVYSLLPTPNSLFPKVLDQGKVFDILLHLHTIKVDRV